MGREVVRIGEYRLAFLREGRGEPVFLLHGITTYSFIWREVIPRLKDEFELFAVDLLGCGESDKPAKADCSIKAHAEILPALIGVLGLESVHLVCHDIGGGIGQIMAVRYPEILKSLTLVNTVGYDYWPVQPIASLRIPFLREIVMALMDRGVFRSLIRRALYYKDRLDRDLMERFERPLRTREGRQGFLSLARCLNNRDLLEIAEDLKRINLPVLIVRGDADPYLSPRISERLHSDIPGSILKRVKTGSHFLQLDEPELLASLVRDFIISAIYMGEQEGTGDG